MNRDESLAIFIENEVKKVSEENLEKLNSYYHENKEELKKDFLKSFLEICKIAKDKRLIAFITYSMLRVNLMKGKNAYLVEVSNPMWFLDDDSLKFEYNADWAFRYLEYYEEKLNHLRKPYMGRIGEHHIKRLMFKEASKYNEYIVALIRYSLKDIEDVKDFEKLDFFGEFEVRVGEYRDRLETVYRRDITKKESFIIKEYFEEKDEDDTYSYRVYKNLNLSRGNYRGLDFRYCDFRKSDLKGSNIRMFILIGTNFEGVCLKGSDIRRTLIYEANFKGADLKKASFKNAKGSKGKSEHSWNTVGFEPVDFKGANLEEVNFNNADLEGADFRGAKFLHTSFKGTKLKGARFLEESKEKLYLSEIQLEEIIWEESI